MLCDTIEQYTGPDFRLARKATSYDRYLKHSELRIDLDWDDNGSRFGPHYYADPICTRTFRVADDDVKIRSWVDTPDAVTVRLRPGTYQEGFDRLHSVPTPGVNIIATGDTLLRLERLPQGTVTDLEMAVSRLTMETTAPDLMYGERIVETHVHAGAVRSDMARTFIQVEPAAPSYAGPDTAVYVCPGTERVDMLAALGPGVDGGGRWFPHLAWQNEWQPFRPFGTYRYTVARTDCSAVDTAYVTIGPAVPPSTFLPLVNTNVNFCTSDTLFWSVDLPTTASVVWDDGSTDRVRALTQPGFYTGRLSGTDGCHDDELIYLRLIDFDAVDRGSSLVEACAGESFEIDGRMITTNTSITRRLMRPDDCDSLHTTIFRFDKPASISQQAFFCSGDTIRVRDSLITASGRYSILVHQPGVCDTVVELEAIAYPSYNISIDTVLPQGDTLFIGSLTLTESGVYPVALTTISGCDSLFTIALDFTTSTNTPDLVSGYFAPTLLRQGMHRFIFYDESITTIEPTSLEIFSVDGRRVFTAGPNDLNWEPGGRDASVPVGLYFYRASFGSSSQLMTGRVMVSR